MRTIASYFDCPCIQFSSLLTKYWIQYTFSV
uniref:Uncharacterized protein n=1 Tax=Anguilla anguilla TaxID=7936 RepID=A0A0E9VMB2_ANGAN